MKTITFSLFNSLLAMLMIFSFSACIDTEPIEQEEMISSPLVVNVSPDDMTIDLLGENNTCSKVVTLHYNITNNCPIEGELTTTIDAPGLVSQSDIDADGNVYFDVEFCALDPDVIITMTAMDPCGSEVTHQFEVTVDGESCVSFFCQKFEYALGPDGSLEVNSRHYADLTGVSNLCDHIGVDISYSGIDVNDTLKIYDCETITLQNQANIQDSLYYWANGEIIESCRIIVFISNDPNGDGDQSDGWREICGF